MLLGVSHPFWEWVGPLLRIGTLISQFIDDTLNLGGQMSSGWNGVEEA